jgi:hypothetical protein
MTHAFCVRDLNAGHCAHICEHPTVCRAEQGQSQGLCTHRLRPHAFVRPVARSLHTQAQTSRVRQASREVSAHTGSDITRSSGQSQGLCTHRLRHHTFVRPVARSLHTQAQTSHVRQASRKVSAHTGSDLTRSSGQSQGLCTHRLRPHTFVRPVASLSRMQTHDVAPNSTATVMMQN